MRPFRFAFARLAILLAALLTATPTLAITFYWVGPPDGDWHDPAHWSDQPDGPGGAGVPGVEDEARFEQQWADISFDFGDQAVLLDGFVLSNGETDVTLLNGTLQSDWMSINDRYNDFRQRGGTVRVNTGLTVNGLRASYLLEDGDLIAKTLHLGEEYRQSGGTASFDLVEISDNRGDFSWAGGDLAIGHIRFGGFFTGPETPRSIEIPGLIDLTRAGHIDADQLSIVTGANGLVLLPAEGDPLQAFAGVSGPALVHRVDQTLVVPAGRTLKLIEKLETSIDLYGRIERDDGFELSISGSLTTHPGSSLDIRFYTAEEGDEARFAGGDHSLTALWARRSPNADPTASGPRIVIESGEVSSNTVGVGRAGRLEIRGGKVTGSGFIMMNGDARGEQSGGEMEIESLFAVDGGEFLLSGGNLSGRELRVAQSVISSDDLSSASWIQTGGQAAFASISVGASLWGGPTGGRLELAGGSLKAGAFSIGDFRGENPVQELAITDPTAELRIDRRLDDSHPSSPTTMSFWAQSRLDVAPGSGIRFHQAGLRISNGDPQQLADLINLTAIFEGAPAEAQEFWFPSEDRGASEAGFDLNFALGTLELGGEGFGWVELNSWRSERALYVDTLILHAGSILELNGFNLYYRHLVDEGGTVIGEGGALVLVPEPNGVALILAGLMALGRRRGSMG